MKALLIDNDLSGLEVLSYNLLKRGHMICTSQDGSDGLDLARGTMPDIIVLDYSLPGISGPELCGLIRRDSDVPIVFLSAFADDAEKASGLSAGADDYIVKPYNMQELLTQLELLANTQGQILRSNIQVGGIDVDAAKREVRVRGRKVSLSPRQLKLLYFLVLRQGRAFSKQDLLREVWRKSFAAESDVDVVDNQIRKLREVVERNPSSPKLIVSVKRIGYKVKKDSEK